MASNPELRPRGASADHEQLHSSLQRLESRFFASNQAPHDNWSALWRPSAAEFLASFYFVFISCGVAIATSQFPSTDASKFMLIPFSFGLSIFVLAFAFGHVSGGYINWAVTLGLMATKRISYQRCIMYFFAQLFGGLLGGGILAAVTPIKWHNYPACFGATTVSSSINVAQGLVVEILLTFLLVFTVNVAVDANAGHMLVPLAVGFCVTICHFIGVPLTGCGINPTRSFASAVVSSGQDSNCLFVWHDHWIYWIGPMIGGVLASFAFQAIFAEQTVKFNVPVANELNKLQSPGHHGPNEVAPHPTQQRV